MRAFFTSAIAVLFLCTSGVEANETLGSAMNTDDICAVRPDLCGKSMKRTKRRKDRSVSSAEVQKKKKKKVRKRPALGDDADNDFFEMDKKSDQELEAAADMNREPAFAKPEPAAVAPAAPPRRKISFSSYLSANSGHPSLAVRRSTRQDAFQPVSRPSVLTAPGSSSATPEAPDDPGAGSGQSLRENRAPEAEATAGAGN